MALTNFEKYDRENPQIWEAFKDLALKSKRRGVQHYSAYALIQVARWKVAMEYGNDGFKINNTYTPDYARKMVKEYPEFETFFQFRQLKNIRSTNSISK